MKQGAAAVLAARTYPALRQRLGAFDCRACPLHAGRTNLVVDRGSPGASILFVGEAPGREEDLSGRAFVGRSGRLLDQMLLEAGLEPGRDVIIANVVKCRPPDNRPPTPGEAAACLPFLWRQIALLRPRLLGLLGATAARHLLGERRRGGLTELVGEPVATGDPPGVPAVPLFHPAYILRNPGKRPLMVEHLRKLGALAGSASRSTS